jgi:hypothetical protein
VWLISPPCACCRCLPVVWRSTFSMSDTVSLSRMCYVPVPVCGAGLTCLPGGSTRILNNRVQCSATELCTSNRLGFRVLTSTASWSVRHSAGLEISNSAVTVGGRSFPAGSMVLYGGVGWQAQNDDALLTDSWISSDGQQWTQVSPTGFAGAAGSGHAADGKGRIFKIGGERFGSDGQPYVVNDGSDAAAAAAATAHCRESERVPAFPCV